MENMGRKSILVRVDEFINSLKPTLILPTIVALFAAYAAFYLSTSVDRRQRTLMYELRPMSGIFTKPDLGRNKVEIQVGGKTVENISSVRITLYNDTDEDFEQLPIVALFKSPSGQPLKPMQARIIIPPNPAEYKVLSPATQPNGTADDVQRYEYNVKVANRSSSPIFDAEFLFEGSIAPQTTVSIEKKGVRAEERLPKLEQADQFRAMTRNITLVTTSAFMVILILYYYWWRRRSLLFRS
jgi:hypothetical protein